MSRHQSGLADKSGLLISLDNYAFLAKCYGVNFADVVESEVRQRITMLCDRCYSILRLGGGKIGVCYVPTKNRSATCDDSIAKSASAESLLVQLRELSGAKFGASSLAILSASWVSFEARQHDLSERDAPSHAGKEAPTCSDMDIAAEFYKSVLNDSLDLIFLPVFSTEDSRRILYNECSARIRCGDGSRVFTFPGYSGSILQRMGLVSCIEFYVLRRVISMLRAFPGAHVAVNISTKITGGDIGWGAVYSELVDEPEIASRLIIEVFEAECVLGACDEFIRRLRKLGCRIIIRDIWFKLRGVPCADFGEVDIVKIGLDALRQNSDRDELRRFIEAIEVAFGPMRVVVSGIESKQDFEFVKDVGVRWGQGAYVCKPIRWILNSNEIDDLYCLA